MNNKYIRLLFISLVIVIALSFVQDFGEFLDQQADKTVRLGVNQQCKPTQAICSASVIEQGESKRISISMQGPLLPQKTFTVNIWAKGFEFEGIQSIIVSFEMLESDLQPNRVSFTPLRDHNQIVAEHWTSDVVLPVSHDGRTDWIAIVTLRSSKNTYQAQFPFTQNRGYSGQLND